MTGSCRSMSRLGGLLQRQRPISSVTRATPLNPRARAPLSVSSMIRPRTKGPRSFNLTTTDLPLPMFVTRIMVPKRRVRCAAVKALDVRRARHLRSSNCSWRNKRKRCRIGQARSYLWVKRVQRDSRPRRLRSIDVATSVPLPLAPPMCRRTMRAPPA
jgi:hypothetical protein